MTEAQATETMQRPVGYQEETQEERDILAAIDQDLSKHGVPPTPATETGTGTKTEEKATEEKTDAAPPPAPATPPAPAKDDAPPQAKEEDESILPPPDAKPPEAKKEESRKFTGDEEFVYDDGKGTRYTTTLREALDARRRLHGMDQLQRELQPYKELREIVETRITDPEQRKQYEAELAALNRKWMGGKPGESKAPSVQTQRDPEVEEAISFTREEKQRRAEAARRKEEKAQFDQRVAFFQEGIELTRDVVRGYGVELSDADVSKLADRVVQLQQFAERETDPEKKRILARFAANPLRVWLHDNKQRIKDITVAQARKAEEATLASIRKGTVNPSGAAAPAATKPVTVATRALNEMSMAEQDRLTPEQWKAAEDLMIARMEGKAT